MKTHMHGVLKYLKKVSNKIFEKVGGIRVRLQLAKKLKNLQ